tara:strand:+ start:1386 stop:1757 length:372 start_codon:yes stop_codon:yes gene_type:complete
MMVSLIRERICIILFFTGCLYGQVKIEPNENYKIALRMKLKLDADPLLYMDEPKSAHLNTVHHESKYYVVLDELGEKKQLQTKVNQITEAAIRYNQTKYDQIIPVKIKVNVRYNYFSLVSERD